VEPTGRAKCAPDDKLRDTHQVQLAQAMGFAKGLNPSLDYRAFDVAFVAISAGESKGAMENDFS
jgi:hypothetical protein